MVEFPAILDHGAELEPVWPEYWKLDELEKVKATLPVGKWNAQWMQNPTSEEGAIIKREWWKKWTADKLPKLEQEVEVESIKPTEEELDDQIDRVRTQFAEVSKVERPVQSGDYALVNISAKKNNNDLKDFNFQDYLYEVGSNTLTAQLDSKLEAVSPGAIVKFNENLPQLGEENVEVTVLVKEVREKILPDLTDEWVSETTEFDDIKNLKEELEKNIEMIKKRQVASQYQAELTNKLIEEAKIDLPEQLVVAEMLSLIHISEPTRPY